MEFFFDLMTNGLLVGLMYALVAVGFVLIYKATSIINFAQGDLVMFAGYAAAVMLGLRGMPLWLMVLILCIGMIALGFVLERGILRPMVGQPLVSVIMVTIGLSFVLQGLVAIVWGAGTRKLELPVPLAPYVIGPVFISPINVVAAVIALVFLIAFGLFFTRSRLGIAMRAVADDQQACDGRRDSGVQSVCPVVGHCRVGGGGRWHHLGQHAWCLLPPVAGGAQSVSCGDPGRPGQHWRGHCRWPDSWVRSRVWRLGTLIPTLAGAPRILFPMC